MPPPCSVFFCFNFFYFGFFAPTDATPCSVFSAGGAEAIGRQGTRAAGVKGGARGAKKGARRVKGLGFAVKGLGLQGGGGCSLVSATRLQQSATEP
jgi:hypothetical protein